MFLREEKPISAEFLKDLLSRSAPERVEDMDALWLKYQPQLALADDGSGAYISANGERIVFDRKTIAVYWLLSFAGWRVLECYSPAVMCSLPRDQATGIVQVALELLPGFPHGTKIQEVLDADIGLTEVEDRFEGHVYIARDILLASEMPTEAWPDEIPSMDVDRNSLSTQNQAIYDLAWISTAYAFCHELRHLIYAKDKDAPPRRNEELACDRWAREFLTEKISAYSRMSGEDEMRVLLKRSIAAAFGMFVLYETTDRRGDAGDENYPSFADRLNVTLDGTPLDGQSGFWQTYACVLVAILRRRRKRVNVHATTARELCQALIEQIRITS